MNRRNALTSITAILAAPLATIWPKRAAAAPMRTMSIKVDMDMKGMKERVRQMVEDKTGVPPVPQGVIGVTYFKAGGHDWDTTKNLYLDGRDVTAHATEVDMVGGWVVLMDADADGRRAFPIRYRVLRGVLEIR